MKIEICGSDVRVHVTPDDEEPDDFEPELPTVEDEGDDEDAEDEAEPDEDEREAEPQRPRRNAQARPPLNPKLIADLIVFGFQLFALFRPKQPARTAPPMRSEAHELYLRIVEEQRRRRDAERIREVAERIAREAAERARQAARRSEDPAPEAAVLLGVSLEATEDEIRAALRARLVAERLHPDQGGDEEKAKSLIAAQNILIERARARVRS